MSELTITALRFGFLLLLWVLIFSIVSAMRRDLMIGRKAATGAPTARQVRKNPELAEAAPAPVKQQARQLVVTEGPLKGRTIPLAASPIFFRNALFRQNWVSFAVKGATSSRAASKPVSPSVTVSPTPGDSIPITGSPVAMASITDSG